MKDDMLHNPIDFGPDEDVSPHDDPAFDAWLRAQAPTLNAPGTTPRLEMWAAIQSARRTAVAPPRRRTPWIILSAIAAALILGVAIDRYALRSANHVVPSVTTVPEAPADPTDASRLYRMAAAQTLTQAEALLTAFRANTAPQQRSAGMQQLGAWGRQVLGSTRLLIDSPAGTDPQLRALLDDLELVLVQIIQLSGTALNDTERALIEGALQESDLLPRLRTAVPAGIPGAATGT